MGLRSVLQSLIVTIQRSMALEGHTETMRRSPLSRLSVRTIIVRLINSRLPHRALSPTFISTESVVLNQ